MSQIGKPSYRPTVLRPTYTSTSTPTPTRSLHSIHNSTTLASSALRTANHWLCQSQNQMDLASRGASMR
eukprot:scaffold273864_cov31-Tisochrysis_lutea.AAC.3